MEPLDTNTSFFFVSQKATEQKASSLPNSKMATALWFYATSSLRNTEIRVRFRVFNQSKATFLSGKEIPIVFKRSYDMKSNTQYTRLASAPRIIWCIRLNLSRFNVNYFFKNHLFSQPIKRISCPVIFASLASSIFLLAPSSYTMFLSYILSSS